LRFIDVARSYLRHVKALLGRILDDRRLLTKGLLMNLMGAVIHVRAAERGP
jgi:hypothetical protein